MSFPPRTKAIADALGDQIIDDDEPGLATDWTQTHVPLINERAALAAVGDGMLAALSSERFSEAVEGRAPPVHVGANRDFTAVCYGNRAKMVKHLDTWKGAVSSGPQSAFRLLALFPFHLKITINEREYFNKMTRGSNKYY